MSATLRIATRGSELARAQAESVAARLGVATELVVVTTTADRRTDLTIPEIGGRGAFVKEVQQAVLDGQADIAVHSAKDLPSSPELLPEGLVIAAFPERADPRDALAGARLDELASGARVGTGSPRRLAQLANARPDLTFVAIRGSIATRLARLDELDSVVVAAAALVRLGRQGEAAEVLAVDAFVPQVGQGALAVECRAGDAETAEIVGSVDDPTVRRAVEAERAFLAALGGGCHAPVAAHATVTGETVTLTGLLASPDGRIVLRTTRSGADGSDLGQAVARELLEDSGGRELVLHGAGA